MVNHEDAQDTVPLKEYFSSKKEKIPTSNDFRYQRECSNCKRLFDYRHLAFIMARKGNMKIDPSSECSFNLCIECVESTEWARFFPPSERSFEKLRKWEFKMWDIGSCIPHSKEDEVPLQLTENLRFLVTVSFNPSLRKTYQKMKKCTG